MGYPPLWVEVRVVLGTRDSCAEGEVLKRVGHIFTDGSEQEELATGLFRFQLPPWATIFQAEAVPQRAALEWCQQLLQQEGGWIVASDSRAVLSNVLSQRRLTPIMAEVVWLVGGCHSMVYVLANLAVMNGIYTHLWMCLGRTRGA